MVLFVLFVVNALLLLLSGLIYKASGSNRPSFGMDIFFTLCVIIVIIIIIVSEK